MILRLTRYLYVFEIGLRRRDSRMTRFILQTCNKEVVSYFESDDEPVSAVEISEHD